MNFYENLEKNKKNNIHSEDEGALDFAAQEELLQKERKANTAWSKIKRNKTAMVGLVIISIMILISVFAPLLATHDPNAIDPLNAYKKPFTEGHIFGTDEFGRDLYSRVLYGGRVSLLAALGGMTFAAFFGVLLGLVAGYAGGFIDAVIMRIMDGMLSFPFVLLALILMTVLGQGLFNVIIAIGISNVPYFARVVRGQVLVVKKAEYCNASRVLGAADSRILFLHILPNSLSPIIVYTTLNIAGAIITEATLSFLGMGIATPMASWGSILKQGKDLMRTGPHIATISGLFILLTVLGFNLLGDGVRDVLDPKMKK